MERKSENDVNFLDDSPTTDDELKLHKNIVLTIKEIIRLTEDKSKKIIALFGSWGSGKSTVIEILKNIETNNIFIFDSWSHKGELLKRAFLLELAKSLGVEKVEYEEESNNEDKIKIETVLTKKIIDKVVDFKPLSSLNIYTKILTSLILFPIIIIACLNILEYFITPLLNFIISLIPENFFEPFTKFQLFIENKFLILILILIFMAIWKRKELDKILTDFINFYFLKKADITEFNVVRENLGFTNYDYENYLKYILDKARLDESKPFIIVFDNLDRVDNEVVLNTLSLIQLTSEIIEKYKNNKIYFLIPIDKERLENIVKTIITGDENREERFAKDFLEKIFSYKVNIPNIQHSNWRKFFKNKIKESFSNINENDIFFARRLFERSITKSKEKNLTPREIKSFINDLVGNYLCWENKIDIKLQVLYIVLYNYFFDEFKKYVENIDKLKNSSNKYEFEDILGIAKEKFDEKEIREAILKQYYKVEEIYTLFVDRVIKTIEDEKIEDLKNIVNVFDDKDKVACLLEEVWEQKDEFKKDINLLMKFYKSLKETGFYEGYKERIIFALKELIKNIDTLSKLKDSSSNELSEILENEENIKELFANKSVEIITTTFKGESDE